MTNQTMYRFTNQGCNKAFQIIDAINVMGGKARLGQTYMDYGAGIMWQTILVHSKSLDMEYQALSPRDFEEINNGTISADRVREMILYATKSE